MTGNRCRPYVITFLVIAAAFFGAAAVSLLVPATPVAGAPNDSEVLAAVLHAAELATDAPPRPGGQAVS